MDTFGHNNSEIIVIKSRRYEHTGHNMWDIYTLVIMGVIL